MTAKKAATTKKVEEAKVEPAKGINTIVDNGRVYLDQLVENGNASFDKIVLVSRETMEKAKDINQGNVNALIATGNAAVKAAETLSTELSSYGKQTWEDNVAAVKATMNATSVQEALDLQRDFAKASFEGLVAQTGKLSEMLPQLAKDSIEPINTQAKSAYGKLVKSAA